VCVSTYNFFSSRYIITRTQARRPCVYIIFLWYIYICISVMKTSSVSTHFDGRPRVMTEPPRVAIFSSGREITNGPLIFFFFKFFTSPLLHNSARQPLQQLSCVMVASRDLCRYIYQNVILSFVRRKVHI